MPRTIHETFAGRTVRKLDRNWVRGVVLHAGLCKIPEGQPGCLSRFVTTVGSLCLVTLGYSAEANATRREKTLSSMLIEGHWRTASVCSACDLAMGLLPDG